MSWIQFINPGLIPSIATSENEGEIETNVLNPSVEVSLREPSGASGALSAPLSKEGTMSCGLAWESHGWFAYVHLFVMSGWYSNMYVLHSILQKVPQPIYKPQHLRWLATCFTCQLCSTVFQILIIMKVQNPQRNDSMLAEFACTGTLLYSKRTQQPSSQ